MKKSKEIPDFLKKLIDDERKNSGFSSFVMYGGNYLTTPPKLISIIGRPQLSNIATDALNALEELGETDELWIAFKWRLWAFVEIQDIFSMPFYKDFTKESIFNIWYFYFESKFLIIESILAGLNGQYHCSRSLLRSFLEFSTSQNYFHNISFKSSSYFSLNEYFKKGHLPKWNGILSKAIEKNDLGELVKSRLDTHYKALSNNIAHPYHPKDSPAQIRGANTTGHSPLGLLSFWQSVDLVLEPVLWMYGLNFPMIFHSKDISKKFGFNPPMGLFLDISQKHIFENAFHHSNLKRFYEYSSNLVEVKDMNEWFNSQSDINEDEFSKSWNKEEFGEFPDSLESGIIQMKARVRATRVIMVFSSIKEQDYDLQKMKFPDLSLDGWEKYLRKKNKK